MGRFLCPTLFALAAVIGLASASESSARPCRQAGAVPGYYAPASYFPGPVVTGGRYYYVPATVTARERYYYVPPSGTGAGAERYYYLPPGANAPAVSAPVVNSTLRMWQPGDGNPPLTHTNE